MTRKLGKFERQRIAEILGLRGGSLDRTIDEIETALNAFQDEMGRASEKRYQEPRWEGRTIKIETNSYNSSGAPPQKAERAYITHVAKIYESATRKEIGRSVKQETTWLKYSKPYNIESLEVRNEFLFECLKMANTLGRGYPARKKREEVEKKRRKQRRTQNEREGATEVNRERKKTAPARGLIQGIVKQLHPNKPRGRPPN